MRKTALAAALAVVTMLPGAAMAGGYGPGQQNALHLSGVKLQFHFGQAHHRFFGPSKHKFRGQHHRPRFGGHKRFIVPHHPGFRHGFLGRPDHRPSHLHRGFFGPKFGRFERHRDGHFKHRAFKHRAFKHRAFKHRAFKHWNRGHFKRRHHRRRWH